MRVGSNVKSDNFTAYDTPITHIQHSGKVEPIGPGQDPDFDKQHADTHRGMRWPHKLLILVAGQSVCDRCV